MASENPAIFTDFVRIDDHVQQIQDEPWSMYWGEMRAGEALKFIQDPVPALKERGVDADDYSVQVNILNSEASAIPTQPICIVAMVFPNEKAAFITSYRHTQ
ncbi:hypothetical protein J7E93_06410 [Streptomyces sp. ISL-36]|uniref:hypothetical protein n=1 Tax=Streptomyces sp. ISL-36 TaxID=2819182 RepID=UPI001BE9AFF7|nr:hypothetical protein [Streptomyces sp. ISL-36]MBT2439759.1 hypothetical protein [Streptomyces sp. ISL-36]